MSTLQEARDLAGVDQESRDFFSRHAHARLSEFYVLLNLAIGSLRDRFVLRSVRQGEKLRGLMLVAPFTCSVDRYAAPLSVESPKGAAPRSSTTASSMRITSCAQDGQPTDTERVFVLAHP